MLATMLAWVVAFPTARAADTSSTAAAVPAPQQPGEIRFTGHNLFGDANGVFHTWRLVEHAVDVASPAAAVVVVEVELASVDTANEDRDEHLRTADFFDVAKFPTARVRGHSPSPLPASASGRARYAVRFDVDLHGVKKTLDGEVEVVSNAPLVVEGGFTLLRTDFGVGGRASRWNPMAIDDPVPVRFRIAFP